MQSNRCIHHTNNMCFTYYKWLKTEQNTLISHFYRIFPSVNFKFQQIKDCENFFYKNKLLLSKHQLFYYLLVPASTWPYNQTPRPEAHLASFLCQKQCQMQANQTPCNESETCFPKDRKKNSQAIELRLERHKTKTTELFLSLILWPGGTAKQFEIESLHADYMKSKYTLFKGSQHFFLMLLSVCNEFQCSFSLRVF